MIVLGPRDADLGGAPAYWREGFWRPDTLLRGPEGCAFPAIPFDKCDLVFEYDARNAKQPSPEEQGWIPSGAGAPIWEHDPLTGVLRYSSNGSPPSFWRARGEAPEPPDRGAAYGLFRVEVPSRDRQDPGLDFIFQAQPREGRPRGMWACFSSLFQWRALDDSDMRPLPSAAVEPEMLRVWHDFGMDAELTGADATDDNLDRDDGGKTIGSLDDLLSNEDRGFFRYADDVEAPIEAMFGMTRKHGELRGMIRNCVVSFPGVFLRPAFRAAAQAEVTRLRLVFCRRPSEDESGALFRVRYTAPSLGMRDSALPDNEAPDQVLIFPPGPPGAVAEVAFHLENLRPGEPIWITVERDWRNEADKLRETVFLLAAIFEAAG